MPDLTLTKGGEKTAVDIGNMAELTDGMQWLLSKEDRGRLAVVQKVDA